MLSKSTKLAIYDLLGENFRKGNLIPVSEIEKILKDNGLNYKEYKYPAMQNLLKDLPEFLSFREVKSKGHKKSFVLFSLWEDKNSDLKKKETASPKAEIKKNSETNKKNTQAQANQRRACNNEELKKIKSIFELNVPKEKEFPMATISTLLKDNGISQKDFGYSKMKPLLQTMDFLSVKDVIVNNTPQALVVYHGKNEKSKKQTEVKKAQEKKQPESKNNKSQNQTLLNSKPKQKKEDKSDFIAGFLPKDTEFNSRNFSIPDKQLLSLKQMTNLGYDNSSFIDLVSEDATSALRTHTYKVNGIDFIFPLSITDKNGERLICAIRKAEKRFSYLYFSNYIGPDKERSKDILKREIHFEDFDASIKELASLAKPEPWHYHNSKDEYIILKIYLQYTYYRLASQKKLIFDPISSFAAFNTGLVTANYEEIYGVLMKNTDPTLEETYIFQGFTVAGRQGIGKVLVEHFSPLPERATYIQDPMDIFFDTERKLYIEYDHIIKENISRFPIDFLEKITRMYPKEHSLVERLIKERNDLAKDKYYLKLQSDIESNPDFYDFLKSCLDSSIKKALALARSDYRSIIPSFFPTRNVMSLMLPLIFDIKKGPEAILLVEQTEAGNYQGQTILTLKQCYVNARLIAPVDNTFLNATKIED